MNCGTSSGWFPFQRGIRQGCPISPFLFVMAVEKLADVLRMSTDIRGLNLLDSQTRILQFADDSTIFVEDEKSLIESLSIIDQFKSCSGLGLNLQKSQGINIGEVPLTTTTSQAIPWGDSFKILGINFEIGDREDKEWQINFAPAIDKMERFCDSWRFRNLSLKGRVVVLNSLVIPIVYYQCTMLPTSPKVFKEIDRVINGFMWRGKKAKISRAILEKPTEMGGLGLHNMASRVKAAKMSWLKRLTLPATEPWHWYMEFKLDQTGLEVARQRLSKQKLNRSSPFLAEVFKYWNELYSPEPSSDYSIRNEWLWGNRFLRGKFKKKQERFGRSLGILRVNDILEYGRIMSENEFEERYGCPPLRGLLERCATIFPRPWYQLLTPFNVTLPGTSLFVQNHKLQWVDIHALSSKQIYKTLEGRKPAPYPCFQRWLRAYGGDETFNDGPAWRQWFLLPYKITHEVQLQSFAFKILYRIIPCKVYLSQIKIVESEGCPRCAERDDLFHYFFECPCVKSFWDSLATWIGEMEGIGDFPEDLTEEEFMLGIISRKGDPSLLNFIILCAKFYIYKVSTFNLGEPELFQFLLELKSRLSIERLCCMAEASFNRRFKKWMAFYNSF